MQFEKLRPGDTIGFYSPASPGTCFAPQRFQRGKAFLESKGFQLIPGKLTGKKDFYRSGSIEARAEELNELIRNPQVRCIMSVIGGINSNALVPYIDYEAFRKTPKIVVGFSDASSVLLAIYAKTGISTFYGPGLIPSFGEFPPFVDFTYEFFKNILMEKPDIPYVYTMPEYWTDEAINWEDKTGDKEKRPNQWITVNKGEAEGRVIGGNLNAISSIWGSEYMPEIRQGDILFIEDTSKTASYLERLYSLLRANRVFDKVSGIILGKHERFDDQGTGKRPCDILQEVAGRTDIPFLAEFDCCHTHPMLTLPIGSRIHLDAANQKIRIMEDWLR